MDMRQEATVLQECSDKTTKMYIFISHTLENEQ
jgi:hypothetical protein